jgi:hypothetical protein
LNVRFRAGFALPGRLANGNFAAEQDIQETSQITGGK